MAQNLEITELLREAGWLRALAGSLMGDAAQAEDLLQDAWLASLRRPPRAGEPRPWLARVVRNLARNRRRDGARRAAREAFAHEERAPAEPQALVQQAETQRLLAEAVTRLEPALRDVVVLRYFQGLDSRAAAARLGLPAATVRTRTARALDALRADLDRRFEGGRGAWALVLAPLARGGRGGSGAAATALPLTGIGAGALVGWALALGALTLAAAFAWRGSQGTRPPAGSVALAPAPAAASEAGAIPAQAGTREPSAPLSGGRADRAEPASSATPTPAPEAAAMATLAGTIVVDGRPPEWPLVISLQPEIPPVAPGGRAPRLSVRAERSTLQPEARGRFSFALPAGWRGRLEVLDHELVDGDSALVLEAPRTGLRLALVSRPALYGRILDPAGRAVPGLEGRIEMILGRQDEARLADLVGSSEKPTPASTSTDAPRLREQPGEVRLYDVTHPFVCRSDGRFRVPLEATPDWGRAALRVEDERGYLSQVTPRFTPADGLDLGEFLLERVHALEFVVRDPRGAPIEGALVHVDPTGPAAPSGPSGPDGTGRLVAVPEREVAVRVSAPGYADRVLPAPLVGRLEVVLEPLAVLELQLRGALRSAGERVRLTAERSAFVWDEANGWGEGAVLQARLGSVQPQVRGGPLESGGWIYEFQRQTDGHYRIVGLVPDVPLTIEVLDAERAVVAVDRLSVAAQTTLALALGEPLPGAAEPPREGSLKRRAPAPPR